MKRGQTTQIFFFILAIVIIGLILLFGVKYIMELGSKVSQIDVVRFKTDIEAYADEIGPVYGKWQKLEIDVPAGIETICFVQHETFGGPPFYPQDEGLCTAGHEDYNFLMCQSWQSDTSRNVYTEPSDEVNVAIDLGPMEVGEDLQYYLCIDTSAHYMRIKMTGRGDRVHIAQWE